MTAGDVYTVAGNAGRASGNSGDGGPATAALMANTTSISNDPAGDLYITDNANGTVREVTSATANAIAPPPGQTSALVIAGPSRRDCTRRDHRHPARRRPGHLLRPAGGACTSPYVIAVGAGSYCALPQDQAATLTYNSSSGTYTFTPSPGATPTPTPPRPEH